MVRVGFSEDPTAHRANDFRNFGSRPRVSRPCIRKIKMAATKQRKRSDKGRIIFYSYSKRIQGLPKRNLATAARVSPIPLHAVILRPQTLFQISFKLSVFPAIF